MSGGTQNLGRTLWGQWGQRGEQVSLWLNHPTPTPLSGARLQGLLAHLAIGLREAGLEAGQRVLLATDARPEGFLLMLAAWMLGAVTIHLPEDLPEGLRAAALGRMKATWIVAPTPRALGALELLHGAAVQEAEVLLLEGAPASPGARLRGYEEIERQGKKRRDLRMGALAQQMVAVPLEARAAILYWADAQGELAASALTQEDLLAGLAPLPGSWALSAKAAALLVSSPSRREALLASLRLLSGGHALAFAADPDTLLPLARAVKPALLIGDGRALAEALEEVCEALEAQSVRGALRRGLGWLERRADRDRLQGALSRAERWLERDLSRALSPSLGGALELAWALDDCPEDVRALLQGAGVRLVMEA